MGRYRIPLVMLIVGAGIALAMMFATGKAHAASTKCIAPAAFFADMPQLYPTPIPPPGYVRARQILDAVAKAKPKATDTAWLLEAANGSSVTVFASKGCVRVVLPTPTNVPLAAMRFILLGERPSPSMPERGA